MAVNGAGAVLEPKVRMAQGGKACYQCVHWGSSFIDPLTHSLYGLGPISSVNKWAPCNCPSFPKHLTDELDKPIVPTEVKTKAKKIEGPTKNLYVTNRTYSCPYMSFRPDSGDSIRTDS